MCSGEPLVQEIRTPGSAPGGGEADSRSYRTQYHAEINEV